MQNTKRPGIAMALPFSILAALFSFTAASAQPNQAQINDPHHSPAGFFDIHVCNWPDRPLFFMSLFSTSQYNDIARIEVYTPGGRKLTDIGMKSFRLVKRKNKPEKRVFITQTPSGDQAEQGWYKARVSMKNGDVFEAADYVVVETMARAGEISPADGGEVPVPKQLSWKPLKGAKYYQVFIKDLWADEKVILASKLLTEAKIVLPAGLIKPEGWYSWRIHARDVNEHILLGDFNHGSLSKEWQFTTRP